MEHTVVRDPKPMFLSLLTAVLVLVLKIVAFRATASVSVLGDLLESCAHLGAVAFAVYSLRYAVQPPDDDHHFGHDKMGYFSAVIEGALIFATGVGILSESWRSWRSEEVLRFDGMGLGLFVLALTMLLNVALGLYLVRLGRKGHSVILEADGKRALSDAWTTIGAFVSILLVRFTGWSGFDPLIAVLLSFLLFRTAYGLFDEAIRGLMDATNPELERQTHDLLVELARERGFRFHRLRLRESGQTVHVDLHLQFPTVMGLGEAHAEASRVERRIATVLARPVDVMTHLEPFEIPPKDRDALDS